jgi:hypothetical protein
LNGFSQANKNALAPFTLFGKIVQNEKPVENVSLELLKDGVVQKKMATSKNGKYSFVMEQDTINQKNEYVIHVFKEGTVPKTLIVNTYIPKEEYDGYKYEYVLEITLVPTTLNDIVLQRPSGKIKWDVKENNFGIDQVYAKIIQKEEEQLKKDPDKYLKDLSLKIKKEDAEKKIKEEDEARKKLEEQMRKNREDAEMLMKNKPKQEEAEVALKEKISAMKDELKEISKATDTIKKKPVLKETQVVAKKDIVKSRSTEYDPSGDYQIKRARIELEKKKQKDEKKKNANLASKYETNNVMSSLLDAVDEHDKRLKDK